MSFKKTILAVAAVGALTAATAVPAMALENEFHGMYKMKYFVSNLDNGGGGFYAPTGEKVSAMNYFEQRARLFYNAKANDDLKLVIAFEIDSIFGDKSQGTIANAPGTAFRNSGGAFDTDAVNLETKWVHLDFNVPGVPMNVKVGTQAIKDSLKGILFDVDAAGIYTSTKIGSAAKVNVGYFRGYDGVNGDTGGAKLGVNNLDLVILEGKFNVTKDISVGANYYGYYDYRQQAATLMDHTVGINADAKVGPVAVSGFLAGQLGSFKNKATGTPDVDLSAYAANVAAKVAAGPGSAKLAALYTSGDKGTSTSKNHAWQSLQYSVGGAAVLPTGTAANDYNESGMMLLNRNAAAGGTTTDRAIAYTTNNLNQGLIGVFAGYDATLSKKFSASANAGFAWVARERIATKPINKGTGAANKSDFLGAEVNVELGYKLYDNLTAGVQAAYVILGDYYKGTATNRTAATAEDPENPYTTRIVLSYAF